MVITRARRLAAVMVALALGAQAMVGTPAGAVPKDGMPDTAKNGRSNSDQNNGNNGNQNNGNNGNQNNGNNGNQNNGNNGNQNNGNNGNQNNGNNGNQNSGNNGKGPVRLGSTTPPRKTLTAAQGETGPSVAFDTMAVDGNGRPGIRIGKSFEPAPYLSGTSYSDAAGAQAEWQMLVLNAQDLTVVLNRSYSTATAPNLPKDFQSLIDSRADLNYRVIITNHPTAGWAVGEGLLSTFEPLGYTFPNAARFRTDSLAHGDFSMVGSVIKSGGQPVQKNFQTKWSDKLEGGRIQAQFMLNSWGNYTYMSNQFVTVDTRSAYDCDSSLGTCTVRIRAGSPTNDGVWSMKGGAGYVVARYDKLTMERTGISAFVTNGPDSNNQAVAMTKALAGLSKDHPGDVVVVSSIRNPEGHNVTVARDVRYDTMSALANQIAAIGGSRDQFNRAAATEGADYNLVGWFDDPSAKSPREGTGVENVGADARLSVEMSLNSESLFRPSVGSPIPLPVDGLREVSYRPNSNEPWPEVNTAAMADIARRLNLPQTDIRQAYWRLADHHWADDSARLARQKYVPTTAYTETEFNRTKQVLEDEFTKVQVIRDKAAALGKPYEQATAETQNVANNVAKQIAVDKNTNVQWSWMKFGDQLVGSLGSLMGFGNATKWANQATKLVAATVAGASRSISAASAMGQYGKDTNVPTYEQISIKAADLSGQVQAALTETRAGVNRQADMILADHAKFAIVSNWSCTAADDPASPEGSWTWCHAEDIPDYFRPTHSAALRSAERVFWTGLAPLEFGVYQLDVSTNTDLKWYGYGLKDYNCGSMFWNSGIFGDSAEWPEETVARLQLNNGELSPKNQPWMARPEYQIYVMGKIKYSSPWSATNTPQQVPASIYHRMFDPISTADLTPATGGLGIRADKYIPTLPHNPLHGCYWSKP